MLKIEAPPDNLRVKYHQITYGILFSEQPNLILNITTIQLMVSSQILNKRYGYYT